MCCGGDCCGSGNPCLSVEREYNRPTVCFCCCGCCRCGGGSSGARAQQETGPAWPSSRPAFCCLGQPEFSSKLAFIRDSIERTLTMARRHPAIGWWRKSLSISCHPFLPSSSPSCLSLTFHFLKRSTAFLRFSFIHCAPDEFSISFSTGIEHRA